MKGPFHDQADYETVAGVVVGLAREAVWVVVQGGRSTSPAPAVSLAKVVLSHMLWSCHREREVGDNALSI
jgi:hypothetical protein